MAEMIMMFKLVVFLVVMFGGADAKQDYVENDRQLSVHLANIVEQMTRLMDEFQVRMERLEGKVAESPARMEKMEEKMEELPARMERMEEKMDVGMNRSNNMMEKKIERLEGKMEELPVRMERLEDKMDVLMNRSKNMMDESMDKLEGKVEEIPIKMDKLENEMDCQNWFASRSLKYCFYLDQSTGKIMTQDYKETFNMSSDWIVIQRRVSADVDFFRGWNEYKNGFGDLQGRFWLGLDNIHTICSRHCQLNINMSKVQDQDFVYPHYNYFRISDEKDKYRLHVTGYNGTAGDGLTYHNGMQFSTKDNDNDKSSYNCAESLTAAFWYNDCSYVNPNGHYFIGPPPGDDRGIFWYPYTSFTESLKFIEMKVKPTS